MEWFYFIYHMEGQIVNVDIFFVLMMDGLFIATFIINYIICFY